MIQAWQLHGLILHSQAWGSDVLHRLRFELQQTS